MLLLANAADATVCVRGRRRRKRKVEEIDERIALKTSTTLRMQGEEETGIRNAQ
jgi:hypothetical protein